MQASCRKDRYYLFVIRLRVVFLAVGARLCLEVTRQLVITGVELRGFPAFNVCGTQIERLARLAKKQKNRLTPSQLLDALCGKMPATRKDF